MSQSSQTRLYEHIVNAIAYSVNQYHDPASKAYKLCSPLLLQSFALPGKHIVDESGLRVFDTDTSGTKASCYDMSLKITGLSRAKLRPTDALKNLLAVYRVREKGDVDAVIKFLRISLEDDTISEDTQLSRFTEAN